MIVARILGFFFDHWLGRLAAFGLLVTTLITGFAFQQRSAERRDVIGELNTSAADLAKSGEMARAAADQPGAAERLLKHSCRDC